MKKKKNQRRLTILLVVLFLVLAGVGGYEYYELTGLTEANNALREEMSANQQVVYVPITNIEAGDTIMMTGDGKNVEQQVVYSGLESYNYITSSENGVTALIDINAGTPIMYSMITDTAVDKDERDYEIAAVNLTVDQAQNDVVDVRITFPDGSDYIVLSKIPVNKLNMETNIFSTHLNEEEILRYTSAIVDAYTTTGTRLYTTRYIQSTIQEEATPNYPVKAVISDLIASDPNVVTLAEETLNAEARLSLENRLFNLTSEEMTAVNDGFGLQDTAHGAALNANGSSIDNTAATEDSTDTTADAATNNTTTGTDAGRTTINTGATNAGSTTDTTANTTSTKKAGE